MPYQRSQAQQRYLRRMYAQRREQETCCDCPGCVTCTGHIRNCTCDLDLTFLNQGPTPCEPSSIVSSTSSDEPPY